ncbi:hypothetical protein DC20_18635 [Rufibacter tibetensis]|uniref:Uncharacterized protein n=1 Tax=Rufibacter tibetensis TaxID=512763 RepID=A0A0P0CAF6_9BACT|nr:hypothetical protein DC20_18635 [Rufibacter tibetensis]
MTSLVSSCGDNEVTRDPEALGHHYFPLELGRYSIFNVTETKYTNNVKQITSYQTRELINEVSTDQTGKDWYRVEVSRRNNANDVWTITGVKMISKTFTDVEVKNNNRTTVEMVFPVVETKEWNPNAFNTDYDKEEEEHNRVKFFYQDVARPFEIGGKSYANTVKVIKSVGDPSVFNYLDVYEVYSKEQGPVYRFSHDRYYCDAGPGTNCQVGSNYIISGLDRIETLTETGKI